MAKKFTRRQEDFECLVCGTKVEGSGYTNHCPECLYSRHVDEKYPGDRESNCKGLMKPISVEAKSGNYVIIHKCNKCGKETRNKTSKEDNFEMILNLS